MAGGIVLRQEPSDQSPRLNDRRVALQGLPNKACSFRVSVADQHCCCSFRPNAARDLKHDPNCSLMEKDVALTWMGSCPAFLTLTGLSLRV